MSDGVEFSLPELMAMIEDLMRVADDLVGAGDEVNALKPTALTLSERVMLG